jgi:DNA-binding transcriptional MerR regulator
MDAGEILAQVERLTHDKLTYFVRVGYIKPKKVKHGTLYYNEFSQEDLEIIKRAWEYITLSDMRVRAAFEKARKEVEDLQLRLPLRATK